ncbi:MAG: hypothetical protein PHN42_04720 [Bacilli bacterium]|nr:hypothetical protein [Bacilli bacterium]
MNFSFVFKSIILSFFIFLIVYAIGNASTLKVLVNGNNFGVKNSVKESLNIGELRATGNVTFDTEVLKESTLNNYKSNNPRNVNDIDFKIYLNNNIVTVNIISNNLMFNGNNNINGTFAYEIYKQ